MPLLAAEHYILPEVQMIIMQDIHNAYDKQVRFRYVIDIATLKQEA